MNQPSLETPQRGSFISNLAFNLIIPVVILSQFSGTDDLGPVWSIVIALSFPISYGLWDLKQSGKVNVFSILGIVSIFLTGGMSLLALDPQYIAIKEAMVPAIIGTAVLVTQKTRYPVIKLFILNEQLIRTEKLYAALSEKQATDKFEKILARSSYIVAASFALSSALNYVLAKVVLVSPPGTTAFSEELGRMTALSYPVIVLPSMAVMVIAIWYLFSQIGKLTGESIENFVIGVKQPDQS